MNCGLSVMSRSSQVPVPVDAPPRLCLPLTILGNDRDNPLAIFELDLSILHFYFSPTIPVNAALWLIGEFVSQVETAVVLKNNSLSHKKIMDHLSSKKLECHNISIPDIGFIPGLSNCQTWVLDK